jgi:ferrous iron transport protein B
MSNAENKVISEMSAQPQEAIDVAVASARLENSYAGQFGHFIEPAIRPLG